MYKRQGYRIALIAGLLAGGGTGCAKDALNRALFSMGEQAQCARVGEHRIDGKQRHTGCLADALQGSEFDEYSKAREQHLAK